MCMHAYLPTFQQSRWKGWSAFDHTDFHPAGRQGMQSSRSKLLLSRNINIEHHVANSCTLRTPPGVDCRLHAAILISKGAASFGMDCSFTCTLSVVRSLYMVASCLCAQAHVAGCSVASHRQTYKVGTAQCSLRIILSPCSFSMSPEYCTGSTSTFTMFSPPILLPQPQQKFSGCPCLILVQFLEYMAVSSSQRVQFGCQHS